MNTPSTCSFDILQLNHLKEMRETKREYNLVRDGRKGNAMEISSPDGIHFGYFKVYCKEKEQFELENRSSYYQLSFNILGQKEIGFNADNILKLNTLQYNYLRIPAGKFSVSWQSNQNLETFDVGITEDLFDKLLPPDHLVRSQLEVSMTEQMPFTRRNLPLQSHCTTILYQMLNCPLDGYLKRLYLHAKTVELVSWQLQQFEMELQNDRTTLISNDELSSFEIERMHEAKALIEKNSDSPCKLIDLAHSVGTNDTYLKKHFKIVFGTTVFAYLLNFKMKKAMELLKDNHSISEVAVLTGYNQVAHFSRAFKRQFGFPPNKVKK